MKKRKGERGKRKKEVQPPEVGVRRERVQEGPLVMGQ